ncbi:hypothetical protein [Flavobacterium sp. LC2016-01]|uniref:hypothetical protein n=1 Tax=Flavobacterium sp. LC2016-01 TaxID=2675876 RepID=UPI0012BB04FC|nr:hypothetical protein [Flavobacterium sp. LC2016-01]MTH14940.1 hypothetical protein [Flavobacterium sp. LC2016-01]
MSQYSSESEFIIKYKSFVIRALAVVTFFIAISFADFFLLPTTKANDIIISYSTREVKGKSISYHFFTKKGFTFTTEKYVVDDADIAIEYSLLFKSVTNVKSKNKDYTKLLVNGLSPKGIQFYFFLVLLFSIAISLKILLSEKQFTENAFYNIICFNGFMVFLCFYMFYLF